ncbi:malonyl-CoA-acyl carrier protein transacylase, mitochondrial isoform X1 [Crotalus tigris]|uniref:malonyl-CoA-acyl carrier protein transacylase, mitochondrial isoform X1 n=1 Tax=Crotalus tigris TaxID=88082 RepID=UPI00192F4D85|nr:malonyl-CoA-acyl carrier protein transacylase, mitochondrial isoform X1 [Crotalus tigris]
MFLSHVISHLDRYAQHYPSQWAMVMAVSAGLQGEAAAWAADLYSDHARELANTGLFLDALRAHFEDITRAQHAEAELLALRQHGRRATDYVREFRRVAGRLRSWPERLLVHQFRAGLDRELHQACVLRGVPSRLQDWFRVVIDLDTGLQEFWGKGEEPLIPGRPLAKLWEEGRRGPPADVGSSAPSARVPFRCFRCNQPGHRAADCPAPSPQAPSSAPGKPTPRANKTPDTSRAAQQPEAGTSQQSVPKEEEEEATAATRYRLVADDSDDDIANDPMGAGCEEKVGLTESREEAPFPEVYSDLAEVFSEQECNILPPHRATDCAIDILPGAKLPKTQMYAMTPRELEELRCYINQNLARGLIQPPRSRVATPVLFKEKKDGSLRLCVDFRRINAVCVDHLYPLPLMKDLLAHLGRVFRKLDLREAYYRVRIKSGDEWKMAFNCPLGSYQFHVMPFGLQGAPTVFMQLINQVLHKYLYRGVLVYLDDILIYTTTLEEHVHLVRQVLRKLLDACLFVKLSKCEFHRARLDYLGYRISGDGVEMDPHKVRAVLE